MMVVYSDMRLAYKDSSPLLHCNDAPLSGSAHGDSRYVSVPGYDSGLVWLGSHFVYPYDETRAGCVGISMLTPRGSKFWVFGEVGAVNLDLMKPPWRDAAASNVGAPSIYFASLEGERYPTGVLRHFFAPLSELLTQDRKAVWAYLRDLGERGVTRRPHDPLSHSR